MGWDHGEVGDHSEVVHGLVVEHHDENEEFNNILNFDAGPAEEVEGRHQRPPGRLAPPILGEPGGRRAAAEVRAGRARHAEVPSRGGPHQCRSAKPLQRRL